jgi:predicted nucleotidyltransferase
MINKTDIILSLKKHHLILQKFGVIKCGLFGSFVTGKATDKSDVDLLIVFDPEKKPLIILWICAFSWRIFLTAK